MKIFGLLLCLLSIQSIVGQTTANLQWVQTFGDTSNQAGQFITTDDFGNVYSLGYFKETLDIDPSADTFLVTTNGSEDFYIQKLDPSGKFLWGCSFGGYSLDGATGLTFDNNNNPIIIGYFKGNVDFDPGADSTILHANYLDSFILKLSSNGSFIWVKQITSAQGFAYFNQANAIESDDKDNVYLTGYFSGEADFDPSDSIFSIHTNGQAWYRSSYICKLNPSGELIWAKAFLEGTSGARSIALDKQSNVYICGEFGGTTDFDPGPGVYNLVNNSDPNTYIAKLDSLGNFVMAKQLKVDNGGFSNTKIKVDNSSNIFVSGSYKGTADFDPGPNYKQVTALGDYDGFFLKLNSSGNLIWDKQLKSHTDVLCTSIDLDSEGNLYITGSFSGLVEFNPGGNSTLLSSQDGFDIFICRYNAAGNLVWLAPVSGNLDQYTRSIHVNKFNEVYTTGLFESTPDFDPSSNSMDITSHGKLDVFVHKLGQPLIGLKEINNRNQISLYPNPSPRFVNVLSDEKLGHLNYSISNVNGQIIERGIISELHSSLDFGNKSPGLYIVSISTKTESYTYNVVVK